MFFDYDYYGELKQTMIICQLKHNEFKMNILYEDYEGITKCIVSSNICNIIYVNVEYDEDENEDVVKIKKVFIEQLKEYFTKEYTFCKCKVPEYIQEEILQKILKTK